MKLSSIRLLAVLISFFFVIPMGYARNDELTVDSKVTSDTKEEPKEYSLMLFLHPIEERLDEFYQWYHDEHLQEVLDRPIGFVSGRSYTAVDFPYLPKQNHPTPHLIKYDIVTSDLKKFFELDAPLSAAARLPDPPLHPKDTLSFFFEKIGPELKGAGPLSTGKGELKTYIFCSINTPKVGREEEFNRWYDSRHVAEVIATPGFVSAQRYKRTELQRYSGADGPPYMVIYSILADDLQPVFEDLNKRHESFVVSDAIDASKKSYILVYEALTPLVKSSRTIKSGETWVVPKTTTLTALDIAEGAGIKAPENHSVTMTVDGVGTEIKYGTYKGNIAITVDPLS